MTTGDAGRGVALNECVARCPLSFRGSLCPLTLTLSRRERGVHASPA